MLPNGQISLTHSGLKKMSAFCRCHFEMYFLQMKYCNFDSNFTKEHWESLATFQSDMDGLEQERRDSINALELRLSCTNPSI